MSIPAFKINSGNIDAPQTKTYPGNRAVIEQSQTRTELDEDAQGNGSNDDDSGAETPGYQVPTR